MGYSSCPLLPAVASVLYLRVSCKWCETPLVHHAPHAAPYKCILFLMQFDANDVKLMSLHHVTTFRCCYRYVTAKYKRCWWKTISRYLSEVYFLHIERSARMALNLYDTADLFEHKVFYSTWRLKRGKREKIEMRRTYLKISILPVAGAVPRSRRPPRVQITIPQNP